MAKQGGVSREHDRSALPKLVFFVLHAAIVGFGLWLLRFGGWEWIGARLGHSWALSDPARGLILLACAALYMVRHAITLFYLLARRVLWSEVFGLLAFIGLIEIGFLLLGAGAFRSIPVPFGWLDLLAAVLVGWGSYLNTASEVQRKLWKRDPNNKGHCYTGGLFARAMHINYFGDMAMFTGWALFTASPWALIVPALMTGMFVFMHIPALDAYLDKRYGEEFRAYAATTKKLIPFVY